MPLKKLLLLRLLQNWKSEALAENLEDLYGDMYGIKFEV